MSFTLARAALAVGLMFAPSEAPTHDFAAEGLDPVALESGVRARVGAVIDEWSIEVRATELRGTYAIELRPMHDPDDPDAALDLREVS